MMNLLKKQSELTQRIITAFFLGTLCLGVFFWMPPIVFSMFIGGVIAYCAFIELPKLMNVERFFFWVVLIGYLVIPAFFLIVLNQSHNRIFLFFLFCAVVSFDSGAYFVGKKWGKHKLAPKISPKKSWEGLLGGFLCVLLVIFILFTYFEIFLSKGIIFSISLLISVGATLGDFFESWLKRQAGVKDSGKILPGHGGILDRIDSLLGALPLWYLITIKYFY